MNKKFSIDSIKLGVQIIFTYSENDYLIGVELNKYPEASKEDIQMFWNNLPMRQQWLVDMTKRLKIKLTEIPTDLSFEAFWNKYNYKDGGSKKKTKEKYEKLSATEKAAAIAYINIYNSSLARQMVAKAHALTYLNGARWENQ